MENTSALFEHFPRRFRGGPNKNQKDALEFTEAHGGETIIAEIPTGSGKTAIGYTFLKRSGEKKQGPLLYVTPTKTLVDQVQQQHPDVTIVYGRSEYLCLYYPGEQLRADQIPCLSLADCPHRVDQETGDTMEPGAEPCPYYLAKFRARHTTSSIIVCTMAFYFFAQWFQRLWTKTAAVVVDEAHRIANTVRQCLSFEITDYHLQRSVDLLKLIEAEEAVIIQRFLRTMRAIINRRCRVRNPDGGMPFRPTLLKDKDIEALLDILKEVDPRALARKIGDAIKGKKLDPKADRDVFMRLEQFTYNLNRYIRQLEYALPDGRRHALNFTVAIYRPEPLEQERVQHKLQVKCYYVAPLIARILPKNTLAMSATIGDKDIFTYESGVDGAFLSLRSDFSASHTRIFVPNDTLDLSFRRGRTRRVRAIHETLERIAGKVQRFARQGLRTLVVVVSNAELQYFAHICEEKKINLVAYGNGISPREAAMKFKGGEGDVLVGTAANYGEGVDLPKQIAPVIFFLRPGNPSPEDPGTQFEQRRHGGSNYWKLVHWRAMIQALQVRGRNVRSAHDLGVTFFMSRQFLSIFPAALPGWLKLAFCGELTVDQCVKEAERLLM